MAKIHEAEDVETREVAEWAYGALFTCARNGQAIGPRVTENPDDARRVEGVYALEVGGDGMAWFEIHTSDGSIFEALISRKKA